MNVRKIVILAILAGTVLPISCRPAPPAAVKSVAQPDGTGTIRLDDFSLEMPDGDWVSTPPDRNKTRLVLLSGASPTSAPKAMIKIDVGRAVQPSAELSAKAFAESTGGTILEEPWDFDGAPGLVITTESRSLVKPSHAAVIYRNDKLYMLMGATSDGQITVGDAFESIRASWRWNGKEIP